MAEIVERRRLTIPIRPYIAAELNVPFPMASADWDQMMAVLEAMKPGLVKDAGVAREGENG